MEARIKTLGIDAIYFPVKDVQRSIAFYRDTVGVEPSGVSEEWGAEYDLPQGAGWGFGPAHRFGGNTSPATVFFAIPDVRAAVDRLREKGGYTVGEIMDTPVCIMAFVNDADGNILCLHQRKTDILNTP